jgi:hypothetical protein
MLREINKGLMVTFINDNLPESAHYDVRKSTVCYDEDKMFVWVLPDVMGPRPSPGLAATLHKAGVRYFSIGIV